MTNHSSHNHASPCHCCMSWWCPSHSSSDASSGVNRRDFMTGVGAGAGMIALSSLSASAADSKDPVRNGPVCKPLKIQPVLVYGLPQRREGVSWRSWGAIQTSQHVTEEINRINGELESMKAKAGFPMEILPIAQVQNPEQGAQVAKGGHDVLLMYAAGSWGNTLEALTDPDKWTIVFLRHRSGPVYLWYEIISNRYLRKTVDEFGQPGVDTRDVVVDEYDDVLMRLRALSGLKNTMNKKIICIGGASGWGAGGQKAPDLTRDRFNMELIDVPYDELGKRILKAKENSTLVKWCNQEAEKYLKQDGITLDTSKDFVTKCFLLTEVFHQLMAEAQTDAITVNQCMGTIMQVSETTACLPLSLINDDGYLAFCESDFVVIPSGILLHYISGKPAFLQDPTYPHNQIVTLAHCTAPRKMDGEHLEPAKILTHFESDWGAAPKVEMKLGQKITVIDPDFNFNRWLGFEAEIIDNPFLDICRSQIDIQFQCDTDQLNDETRGFHWMLCYDNYLKETEYAVRKAGMEWKTLA
ncbi:MAG: twin-arginine translocation signal domain-containing protein [Candidatus Omnitrophica bacterium]|nr:twin-arginine translocation signal domain-containing protein [Candidatus Omnitrophota bacterium]